MKSSSHKPYNSGGVTVCVRSAVCVGCVDISPHHLTIDQFIAVIAWVLRKAAVYISMHNVLYEMHLIVVQVSSAMQANLLCRVPECERVIVFELKLYKLLYAS